MIQRGQRYKSKKGIFIVHEVWWLGFEPSRVIIEYESGELYELKPKYIEDKINDGTIEKIKNTR